MTVIKSIQQMINSSNSLVSALKHVYQRARFDYVTLLCNIWYKERLFLDQNRIYAIHQVSKIGWISFEFTFIIHRLKSHSNFLFVQRKFEKINNQNE